MTHTSAVPTVGDGEHLYRPVIDWMGRFPNQAGFVEAIGVAVDSADRVFVFNRGNPAVFVFDSDGTFLTSWGDGEFVRPHGITFAPDDTLFLTDDLGHRVAQYTRDGEFLRNIGPAGTPSATGVQGFDYRSLTAAGPYNLPTNTTVTEDGHLYVADGYGNAAIHHFDANGNLLHSWGESGSGEGQFNVPHGICNDGRRIFVADRENSRVQIFDRDGRFLAAWTDVVRPCQVLTMNDLICVAELGNQNGRFPWQPLPENPVGGRVSIFDADGNLLSRWGGGLDARRPDAFYAAHDIAVDSRGSIYIGEVAVTAAKAAGEDSAGLPTLRKFKLTSDAL